MFSRTLAVHKLENCLLAFVLGVGGGGGRMRVVRGFSHSLQGTLEVGHDARKRD